MSAKRSPVTGWLMVVGTLVALQAGMTTAITLKQEEPVAVKEARADFDRLMGTYEYFHFDDYPDIDQAFKKANEHLDKGDVDAYWDQEKKLRGIVSFFSHEGEVRISMAKPVSTLWQINLGSNNGFQHAVWMELVDQDGHVIPIPMANKKTGEVLMKDNWLQEISAKVFDKGSNGLLGPGSKVGIKEAQSATVKFTY
ncbi:hypothetical protein ACYPKM_01000 [Pseudomonas aeruginosa]